MRNKKVVSILLTLLLLFGVLSLTVTSAAAADELGTAQAGDKVAVTGGNGHQYFYADSAGNSGYYWASYMTVAISERNGAAVDYVNGAYKSYYAWCASYGEDVPKATQEYLLIDGQKDENGDYYYVDEALSQNGVKGLKIPFWWALSVIKSAERLAIQNGHASYDYRGAMVLPVSYRFAVEVAIRCISDEVNANEQDITYGYGSPSGEQRLQEVGWTVADFYKAVKDIYNGAVNKPYEYEPPITEITASPTAINQYEGSYLILGRYSLNVSGAAATLTANTTAGVEAVVDGNTLTVRIAKEKISKDVRIDWGVDLSYTNGQTYTMLFGLPIDKNGNVLDTPQNIMLYDAEPFTVPKNIEGRYNPWEEKATVTVQKTDENGKALSGMKFDLYSVGSNNALTFMETLITDENGVDTTDPLNLGDYFLVENCEGTGYEPHKPEQWKIDGATSAVYTTIGGKSGWKISLAPGDVGATVSAVNKETLKDLNILKTDTEGNSMPGFKFTVYPVNADGTLGAKKQGTTNASGLISFSKLPIGTYFLVENCEGTGYEPDKPENWLVSADEAVYTTIDGKQGWRITLSKNNASIEAVNKRSETSLLVEKSTTDDSDPQGFKFTLYPVNADGTLGAKKQGTTNASGLISFSKLPIGTYFLVENYEGTGYEPHKPEQWKIDGATSAVYTTISGKSGWKISLAPGDVGATVSAVNKETLKDLNILKTDTEGNSMPGFKFTVYPVNADGTLGTGIAKETRSDGYVFFTALKLGDYFVVENYEDTDYEPDKPENWYVVADEAEYTTIGGKQGWKITLSKNNATIEAVNKRSETSLLVEKFTTDDSDPQGFKFTLYPVNADGTLGAKKQGTTNESGQLFFSPLELGTYFLVENCEGTGYAPHKPEQWQIGGVLSKEYTTINGMQGWKLQLGKAKAWVYADNYKIPTLSLNKTDRDGKPIKGMEFSIYTLSGDIPLYIDSFKTDENGYIDFEIKETGSYFIIEEQNGKWEAYKSNEWRVVGASEAEYTTIRGNNGWLLYLDEGDNASIEAVNDYTVSLTLKKQSTAGKTLEGATFALEVSFDNGETFSLLESKTTPESGVITFENLDRYAVYRVTETKAPAGYALLGDAVFVGRIAQEDITLTVGDSLILMMPTTGGNGMWLAALASALFAISAGWLISAGRKRKLSHR